MSIPPELAWLVPIVVPFIMGFLVGAVIKKALKLIIVIAVLIIILIATGALGLAFGDLFDKAMEFLPKLYDIGIGWVNVLPYSSVAFLIGLAIGLWKG